MLTLLNVAYPFAPVGRDAVGGAEQILSAVEEAVFNAGHRSLVLACAGSRATGELFTVPQVKGPLTPKRRAQIQRLYRATIDRLVVEQKVDLVHMHGVDFHTYLPSCSVPVLTTLHLPPSWYAGEVFRTPRPNTYLTCVSDTQRRECPPCDMLLENIPNGVDLHRFHPVSQRGDSVLVLSRVCPEKGVHLALDAAQRAYLPLLLAGHVFPYPEHLDYFQREVAPRLDGKRRFIGVLGMADKPGVLSKARCVVVPSLVPETSSLVAMEALASGVPVVAFPNGELARLVDHGRTGFLVRNVDEMAQAMASAIHLSSRLCRQAAEQRFSAQAMCQRYLDVYARLVPRRASSRVDRASLRVEEIREVGGLRSLQGEWEELCRLCPDSTVFQTPQWLLPWCDHLLQGELRAVTFREGSRLIGLAPLFCWRDGPRRVLSLMGAGVSDRADVLVHDDDKRKVGLALLEWLRDHQDCEQLQLSELAENSLLLSLPLEQLGTDEVQRQEVCPGVALPQATPLESILPAHTWAKLAYARRRAARDCDMQVEGASPESLDGLFDQLEALHAARWRQKGSFGALAEQTIRRFHRDAARRLLRSGRLMLFALRLSGQVAGILYGFHDPRASRYYLSGFDPAFARYSPGMLLVGHAIEIALQRKADAFDFLRGAEPYKYKWGAADLVTLYCRRISRSSVRRECRQNPAVNREAIG